MDLLPAMVTGLQQLRTPFDRGQFDRAIGDRASARLILGHLLRRGLVARHTPLGSLPTKDIGVPLTRVVTAWPRTAGDYRLETVSLPVPPGVVPLAYVSAAIDGEWNGFGVSPDAATADLTARCEALERFGMLHPDLARPEGQPRGRVASRAPFPASLDTAPGVLFDYLREVAPPGAPALPSKNDVRAGCRVVRTVKGCRAVGRIANAWVYLGASTATNTNGAAFGSTLDAAILSAQHELAERDLLLRAWYGLAQSREITRDLAAQPAIARWHHAAHAVGLHARWFLLGGAGGAFVTVACLIGADAPPHFGAGSATRRDLVGAAEKAFFEAAGTHLGHVSAATEVGQRVFVRAALRRASGLPGGFHRSAFERYWAARVPDALSLVARRLSRSRIRRRHTLRVDGWLWVDVTPAGLEHGHVVKAFHPDAVPLPNTMAQVQVLERLLGVEGDGTPPPIS